MKKLTTLLMILIVPSWLLVSTHSRASEETTKTEHHHVCVEDFNRFKFYSLIKHIPFKEISKEHIKDYQKGLKKYRNEFETSSLDRLDEFINHDVDAGKDYKYMLRHNKYVRASETYIFYKNDKDGECWFLSAHASPEVHNKIIDEFVNNKESI